MVKRCCSNQKIKLLPSNQVTISSKFILWRLFFDSNLLVHQCHETAPKMKFSIKDLFSKCDQIRRKLGIWLQLLKKSLMENSIFVQCDNSIFLTLSILTVSPFFRRPQLISQYAWMQRICSIISVFDNLIPRAILER